MLTLFLLILVTFVLGLASLYVGFRLRKRFPTVTKKEAIIQLIICILTFLLTAFSAFYVVFVPKILIIQPSPPGYPPIGKEWKITVLGVWNDTSAQPIEDALITMNCSTNGIPFSLRKYSDEHGVAYFEYREEYGFGVRFEARKGNISASWIPMVVRFIEIEKVNQLTLNFFAIPSLNALLYGLALGYRHFKPKRKEEFTDLEKLIVLMISSLTIVVITLYLSWVGKYAYCSKEWGYPEIVSDFWIFRLTFDDLYKATLIVIFISLFLPLFPLLLRKYIPRKLKCLFGT